MIRAFFRVGAALVVLWSFSTPAAPHSAVVAAPTSVDAGQDSSAAGSAGGLAYLALEPHPGARLPLGMVLRDEAGRDVALGRFFAGRPVVLVLDYLTCKTICGLALGNLADAIEGLPAAARRDLSVVAISIDPRDTPADASTARQKYLGRTGDDVDWHFLTGPEAAVRPIADSIGFHYRYDAAGDQYIHSVGYMVAAGDGTVSNYLHDLNLSPAQLQAALTAAATGQVANPLGRLLLLCFGQGPVHGRYTIAIEAALILLNLTGMLAAIGVFAWVQRRRHG